MSIPTAHTQVVLLTIHLEIVLARVWECLETYPLRCARLFRSIRAVCVRDVEGGERGVGAIGAACEADSRHPLCVGCVGARWRREIEEFRYRGEDEGAPEETLAVAEVVRLWFRCFGEVCAKGPAVGVADYHYEAAALAPELVTEGVQCGESAAVLFEGVDEGPVVHEL